MAFTTKGSRSVRADLARVLDPGEPRDGVAAVGDLAALVAPDPPQAFGAGCLLQALRGHPERFDDAGNHQDVAPRIAWHLPAPFVQRPQLDHRFSQRAV